MNDHTYLVLSDLDQTILTHLIPPSIMTMVRVNRHYNQSLKDKQQIFNKIKMDFEEACAKGHYWLAKWIYDVHEQCGPCMMWNMYNGNRFDAYGEDYSIQYRRDDIFNEICINGHLQTAKLFRQLEKYIGQLELPNIVEICNNGHFEIVEWLSESMKIDDYLLNILYACDTGHLDALKWLVVYCENKKIAIDIHYQNDLMFRTAVTSDHLDVAKWLIELGEKSYGKIDINANDNRIFRHTLTFEIIRWLDELRARGY